MPTHSPLTVFQATEHPQAFALATARLNFADLLQELFQNARRSHASHLDLRFRRHPGPNAPKPYLLEIKDPGCGIPDPRILLAWGNSQWPGSLTEQASGIGFACMAMARCRVTSKADGAIAWQADFPPAAFRNRQPVHPQASPGADAGTTLHIPTRLDSPTLLTILDDTAFYLPLPVIYRDETFQPPFQAVLLRRNFLDPSTKHTRLDNLNIGIYNTRLRPHNTKDLNVHGRCFDARLPHQPGSDGNIYYALADVFKAPDLMLPPPGNHHIAEQPALTRIREQAAATLADLLP